MILFSYLYKRIKLLEKLVIEGGKSLNGTVRISGAKNAALPILAATLLADGPCRIKNVPDLRDIDTSLKILKELGSKYERGKNGDITTEVVDESSHFAPYDLVRTMRASIVVLGPLLARRGEAKVSFPGGCVIGSRPIDLHFKGLEALGVKLKVEHGYIHARRTGKHLRGASVYLGGAFGPSVLATANTMLAAVLAKGMTVIENAACEPEVLDLANFLIAMGADIKGAGSPRITIEGVKNLKGAEYTIIPDRIEAGTLLAAAAATRGSVTVENVIPEHLFAVIDKMRDMGALIKIDENKISLRMKKRPNAVEISTLPFPGVPTDMQAQLMALLSCANGTSVITDKIYPDRFMHVAEMLRMGANIVRVRDTAIVTGVRHLSGTTVMVSDLRAGAALVIAGLIAKGRTDVRRIYHLDRGYDKLEKKLVALGAKISRVEEDDEKTDINR